MGRIPFLSVVVVIGACGDNIVGSADPQPPGRPEDGAVVPGATVRELPQACRAVAWPNAVVTDLAADVAVVAGKTGATVLAVPTAAGPISGFAFDLRMDATTVASNVPIPGKFDAIAMTMLGDRVISAARGGGTIRVDMLDQGLAHPTLIAKLPGSVVADGVLYTANGVVIVPYGTADGLMLQELSGALGPAAVQHFLTTAPATGVTAAQYGPHTLVAMSTASTCHIEMLETPSTGYGSQQPYPCAQPQLAAAPLLGTAGLVYEAAGGVWFARVEHGQVVSGHRLNPTASAPRIAFDGQRFWISYLDLRGDVVAGFLDDDDQLVSTALAGTRPQSEAYRLAILDGLPWVIGLDSAGYTAHAFCITED